MEALNDLEYDDDDDDDDEDNESFKSALALPPTTAISESFVAYSYTVCVNPLSLDFDSSSHDSDFEDAHDEFCSEEEDEEEDMVTLKRVPHTKETNDNNLSEKDDRVVKEDETPLHSMSSCNEKNNHNSTPVNKEITRIRHPIKVRSMSFNQDRDCLAIATSKGVQIRTIDDLTKSHVHKLDIKGGINCIQVLHRTSLLAMTKSRTPRIVSLVYGKDGRVLKELSFTSAVRRIEMNRMCLVVLTASGELHIFAYALGKQKEDITILTSIGLLHQSESARMMTADGATLQGSFFELSSLCVGGDTWLVTKSMVGVGYVSVYKISTTTTATNVASSSDAAFRRDIPTPYIKLVNTICAHDHSISKIALGGISNDASNNMMNDLQPVFSTASVKGTIIRVFSLTTCEKLHEFQRGSSSCTIHSMAFNSDGTILAVSGSKGTVHLFQLNPDNRVQPSSSTNNQSDASSKSYGLYPILKQWMMSSGGIKGNHGENVVRSFARIRIKGEYARMPNIITMGTTDKTDEHVEENVIICPMDGALIQYAVNHKGRKRPIRAEKFFTEMEGF